MITLNELYDAQIDKAGWRRQPRTVQFGFGSPPRVREKENTGAVVNTGGGELIDPMDRELGRNSGFRMNPGGNISYAVADDADKLWGQALSEYDTRRGIRPDVAIPLGEGDVSEGIVARSRPQANVDTGVDETALRHELFDPLVERFGGNPAYIRPGTVTSDKPTFRSAGDDVYRWNTETGDFDKVIDTTKPDLRGDSAKKQILLKQLEAAYAQKKSGMFSLLSPEKQKEVNDGITAIEKEIEAIYEPSGTPAAAAAAPVRVIPPEIGFIGDPHDLSTNRYQETPKRASSPQSSVNKYPTKALARDYVSKFGANAKAELVKAGYDVGGYAD